jgi:DNA-binding beta-propeller fold protein YncE
VDPTGKFAYAVNHGGSTVWGYAVNAVTGALTPIAGSPFAVGGAARSVAVDPSGKFAYAVDFYDPSNTGTLDGDVHGNTINAATGALTPISGLPFPVGQFLTSIAVSGQIH